MNIGILIDRIDKNQISDTIIKNISANINNPNISPSIFTIRLDNTFSKIATQTSNISDAYFFNGTVISTCYDTLVMANKMLTPKIYHYLFDLYWLRGQGSYVENCSLLMNPKLKIIVPSQTYARELFRYCGKTHEALVTDFNLSEIYNVIRGQQ